MQNLNRVSAIAIAVALSHFIDTESWMPSATRDTARHMVEMLLALTKSSPNADVVTVNTLAKVVHIGVVSAPFVKTTELFAIVAVLLATGSEHDINFLMHNVIGPSNCSPPAWVAEFSPDRPRREPPSSTKFTCFREFWHRASALKLQSTFKSIITFYPWSVRNKSINRARRATIFQPST